MSELIPLTDIYRPETAPSHCAALMELVTPAVGGSAVGFTSHTETAGPVELPPVWRCQCGFQLDPWFAAGGATFLANAA